VLITRQQIIDIFTAIKTAVEGVLSIDGTVDSTVQNWPASQTVDGTVAVSNTERSITASALPTGAATEAKQDTSNTSLTAIKNAVEGTVDVQLTGSSLDLRGLASAKPLATAVDIGVTYWSVDTGAIEVSDGTNWVVV
jgi:hypothetical protein